MPKFVITRYVTLSYTQHVFIEAETGVKALEISELDDADSVRIISDTRGSGTIEIENNDIQSPEEYFEWVKEQLQEESLGHPFAPITYDGRRFDNIELALSYYRDILHL